MVEVLFLFNLHEGIKDRWHYYKSSNLGKDLYTIWNNFIIPGPQSRHFY